MTLQLEKVYDPKNEEDDMREMEEERLRMREHVMKNVRGGPRAMGEGGGRGGGRSSSVAYPYLSPQVDTNQDRLVTLEEFLVSTQRKEFGDTGEGWEVRTRKILWILTVSLSPRPNPSFGVSGHFSFSLGL